MRAAPAVSRAKQVEKDAHEHTGSAENIRHFLRNGFTAYIALTPEYRVLLASVASRNPALRPGWAFAPPQDLTPTTEASGPHDFTVRLSTARQHVLGSLTEFIPPCNRSRPRCRRVHPILSQRSVTLANAPSSGTGWHES